MKKPLVYLHQKESAKKMIEIMNATQVLDIGT
jgi:hypothetical protein